MNPAAALLRAHCGKQCPPGGCGAPQARFNAAQQRRSAGAGAPSCPTLCPSDLASPCSSVMVTRTTHLGCWDTCAGGVRGWWCLGGVGLRVGQLGWSRSWEPGQVHRSRACLPARPPGRPPACLSAWQPACLCTCRLAYLPHPQPRPAPPPHPEHVDLLQRHLVPPGAVYPARVALAAAAALHARDAHVLQVWGAGRGGPDMPG